MQAIAESIEADGNVFVVAAGQTVTLTLPSGEVVVPLDRLARADHFVGRTEEIEAVLGGLGLGKIVALWGPGGIGKTAIVAEALWQLAPDPSLAPDAFPDGVVVHGFYSANAGQAALSKIATAFGIQSQDGTRVADAATRALAGKSALVVLDGTEDCSDRELDEVLQVCSGVAVLLTTRKRRQAKGSVVSVLPLSERDATSMLFAWARRTEDERAARRIVELIGGLPLAVRLAGAYMDREKESAASYLSWLEEQPLAALTHGDERRSESIPILLGRSVERLSETAQLVIGMAGKLAPLPFERNAIAHALGYKSDNDARRPLGEIVDFALLQAEEGLYGTSHRLVYTYARERIAVDDVAIMRLLDYYMSRMKPVVIDGSPVAAGQVERYGAHAFALSRVLPVPSGAELLRDKLQWPPDNFNLPDLDEMIGILSALADQTGMSGVRALTPYFRGTVAAEAGDDQQAAEHYEEAISQLDEGDERIVDHPMYGVAKGRLSGILYGELGHTSWKVGNVSRALECFKRSLATSREIEDRFAEGSDLSILGHAYWVLGDIGKAITHLKQSLVIRREAGDPVGEGNDSGSLGCLYLKAGKAEQAIPLLIQAWHISRELRDRRTESAHLVNLGHAHWEFGKSRKAVPYFEQALAIRGEHAQQRGSLACLAMAAALYRKEGQEQTAIAYLAKGSSAASELSDRHSDGKRALPNLGNVYLIQVEVGGEVDYYKHVLRLPQDFQALFNRGVALANLGVAFEDLGKHKEARWYWKRALEELTAEATWRTERVRAWVES